MAVTTTGKVVNAELSKIPVNCVCLRQVPTSLIIMQKTDLIKKIHELVHTPENARELEEFADFKVNLNRYISIPGDNNILLKNLNLQHEKHY